MPRVSLNGPAQAPPSPLSPFQQFREKWKGGCGSSLCGQHKIRVVLSRGYVPAGIVFIGEAPGFAENSLGSPFVGKAGKLLDRIILNSIPHKVEMDERGEEHLVPEIRYAITNLVGCIPRGEGGRTVTKPLPPEVKKCKPRLVEYIRLCRPRLIVLVGDDARTYIRGQGMFEPITWLPPNQKGLAFAEIEHPASILRKNVVRQGLLRQNCEVIIREKIEELF